MSKKVGKIIHILQYLFNNLKVFLNPLNYIIIYKKLQNTLFYKILSKISIISISLKIIASITAIIMVIIRKKLLLLILNLVFFLAFFLNLKLLNQSKKLLDILKYDENMRNLNVEKP